MGNKKSIIFVFIISFVFFFLISGFAQADTLGQNQSFFISSQYDARSRNLITATLKHVSDRAYFYVEDEYWNRVSQNMRAQILSQIELLAREFDNRIYPMETEFFGSVAEPGVDNDSRITILLSPLAENAGGYFDTSNNYKKEQAPNSNEREMIYLNIAALSDREKINAFLAHEFQHLISFNQKEKLRNVTDDVWLNELRSEYAVTFLGYNDNFTGSHLEKRLKALIENPLDSLTEWKNFPADYGQIGLFAEYLSEHWSPKVIADTLKNASIGIASLNEALKQNGFVDSFADVFNQWAVANILNDVTASRKFGYIREGLRNFHVAPTKVFSNLGDAVTLAVSDIIKDWQSRWYDVSQFAAGQKKFLKISFFSPSLASFQVPYLVFKNDGSRTLFMFNPTVHLNTLYINNIGTDVNRVIFMPIKKDKISGFTADEPVIPLTISVERADFAPRESAVSPAILTPSVSSPSPLPAVTESIPSVPDGSLIRAENDYKVYVTHGRWRRHIISSKIFSFYPHLGFDKVKIVSPSVMAQYQESNLIRYQLGQRVYSIDEAGGKHWLSMTAEQFTGSGRAWDSVFTVNLSELNFYQQGAEIRN